MKFENYKSKLPRLIGKVMLLAAVLAGGSATAFACQECVVIGLGNAKVRFVKNPRLVDKPDVPLVGAKVRVFRARRLRPGEEPRQRLSCLHSYEKGRRVQSGKTDKNGLFRISQHTGGYYWLAVRGEGFQGVYLIDMSEMEQSGEAVILSADENGMVGNKCDIEPIAYFIK